MRSLFMRSDYLFFFSVLERAKPNWDLTSSLYRTFSSSAFNVAFGIMALTAVVRTSGVCLKSGFCQKV